MSSQIRIGDLTLDTGRRLLLCGTEPIQLGPLTYRLLLALVEAAPNIATHEELIDSVWGGRDASPETISQRVKLLRDAISDDAANPRYIQLVRGQGYRLMPPVKVLPAGPAERHWNKTVVGTSIGLIVVVAVAAYFWFAAAPSGTPQAINSIAVLPFVDMSPEQDQAYFADGISQEILNLLAKTTTLRVIARTSSFSFKGQKADIATIAETLNVAHVLEGSVRKSGNRVRITVQLVDTATSRHLWSASYDRELGDILALQAEIATSVAAALEANLLGQSAAEPSVAKAVNPEAFDLYLRGLQQINVYSHASLVRAEQFFKRSISHDPDFVRAYYGLGLAYYTQVDAALIPVQENRARLQEVVTRGLNLAPDNAGLIGLSGQLARYDGNFELAERQLQRALELDPSDIWVRNLYAILKLDQSNPDEALKTHLRTLEIDPLNPLAYMTLDYIYIDLGKIEEALATASRLMQITPPDNTIGLATSGLIKMLMQGDFVGGIQAWEALSQSEAWGSHEDLNMLAVAYYSIGDMKKGDAWLEKARKEAPGTTLTRAVQAYRLVLSGEDSRAREFALDAVINPDMFTRWWGGIIALRLAVDALIDRGEAERAIDLMLKIGPEWAAYRNQSDIAPEDFSPAPYHVKSSYSSYPALYFADLVRALKAAGDGAGAENMLGYLEAILRWRRERGLFVEELHVAEALALRGRSEAALNALERAEKDSTIYNFWQLRLLHNSVFEDIRKHPRFEALVERVKTEINRQRAELSTRLSFFDQNEE
jgi:TolB-like protein/DNA-binding winged helix-turn-helix (wHTH) protein/Tfp pilus assembly protein PilF